MVSTHGCPGLSSLRGRFQEKGNLEVLLFTIQSRMRANNQRVYTPHEGRLVSDINRVRGPSWQPGRVPCRGDTRLLPRHPVTWGSSSPGITRGFAPQAVLGQVRDILGQLRSISGQVKSISWGRSGPSQGRFGLL